MAATADVAIIGAGVIGAAVAHEMAPQTRLGIVVLERRGPVAESSGAATGLSRGPR